MWGIFIDWIHLFGESGLPIHQLLLAPALAQAAVERVERVEPPLPPEIAKAKGNTWYQPRTRSMGGQEVTLWQFVIQFAVEHGPVEIVSFPIENGESFHSHLAVKTRGSRCHEKSHKVQVHQPRNGLWGFLPRRPRFHQILWGMNHTDMEKGTNCSKM